MNLIFSTISIAVNTSVLLGQVLLSVARQHASCLPEQGMMLMDCCALGGSLLATGKSADQWRTPIMGLAIANANQSVGQSQTRSGI